jgi:hypothetical protein
MPKYQKIGEVYRIWPDACRRESPPDGCLPVLLCAAWAIVILCLLGSCGG